ARRGSLSSLFAPPPGTAPGGGLISASASTASVMGGSSTAASQSLPRRRSTGQTSRGGANSNDQVEQRGKNRAVFAPHLGGGANPSSKDPSPRKGSTGTTMADDSQSLGKRTRLGSQVNNIASGRGSDSGAAYYTNTSPPPPLQGGGGRATTSAGSPASSEQDAAAQQGENIGDQHTGGNKNKSSAATAQQQNAKNHVRPKNSTSQVDIESHYRVEASSPDEEALLHGISELGYKILERSGSELGVLENGVYRRWEILGVHEFNSDRRRMGIVLKEQVLATNMMFNTPTASTSTPYAVGGGGGGHLPMQQNRHTYGANATTYNAARGGATCRPSSPAASGGQLTPRPPGSRGSGSPTMSPTVGLSRNTSKEGSASQIHQVGAIMCAPSPSASLTSIPPPGGMIGSNTLKVERLASPRMTPVSIVSNDSGSSTQASGAGLITKINHHQDQPPPPPSTPPHQEQHHGPSSFGGPSSMSIGSTKTNTAGGASSVKRHQSRQGTNVSEQSTGSYQSSSLGASGYTNAAQMTTASLNTTIGMHTTTSGLLSHPGGLMHQHHPYYPSERFVLFIKGADSVMLERCKSHSSAFHQNILDFSCSGLRTLVMGRRYLTRQEASEYVARMKKAKTALENRDEEVDAVADWIERDIEILGIAGLEDRLQVGVPETVELLRHGGIKLWMLTGDKQETAVNVAKSVALIPWEAEVFFVNVVKQRSTSKTESGGASLGGVRGQQSHEHETSMIGENKDNTVDSSKQLVTTSSRGASATQTRRQSSKSNTLSMTATLMSATGTGGTGTTDNKKTGLQHQLSFGDDETTKSNSLRGLNGFGGRRGSATSRRGSLDRA
ncbi:unnamed protein product, partial [Amoebophrya sp. A25]